MQESKQEVTKVVSLVKNGISINLTLKVPSKICSRRHSNFFYFSEKTSPHFRAKQTVHIECLDLFSLKKKKKKKKKIVICCSCDWRFKG